MSNCKPLVFVYIISKPLYKSKKTRSMGQTNSRVTKEQCDQLSSLQVENVACVMREDLTGLNKRCLSGNQKRWTNRSCYNALISFQPKPLSHARKRDDQKT